MSFSFILMLGALIVVNLGLIWFLLAAPLGIRTVAVTRRIAAQPYHLWSALYPLGTNANWDGSYISVKANGINAADLEIAWEGRDGKPIRRKVQFSNIVENQTYTSRTSDDTSLDHSFWINHSETVTIQQDGEGSIVTVSETDSYKGIAFLGFRYFKNRRVLANLDGWARTGAYKSVAIFEKAPMQVALALLSALLLWPFFGLTAFGLFLSLTLTVVVALHELGHMFAFRVMGHRTARMIFIPLLGGIALGGRPYDKHFEVGFSALMGAGFSVFPVIAAISLFQPLKDAGYIQAAVYIGAFAMIGAIFNLGNLVPMWKFDGGQVIRQIFDTKLAQGIASFLLLGGLLAVCKLSGFSNQAVLITGTVFATLSLITTGSGIKPKTALHPMSRLERTLVFAGLLATFAAHSLGTIWGLKVYLALA